MTRGRCAPGPLGQVGRLRRDWSGVQFQWFSAWTN